jgi:hypothetical protein
VSAREAVRSAGRGRLIANANDMTNHRASAASAPSATLDNVEGNGYSAYARRPTMHSFTSAAVTRWSENRVDEWRESGALSKDQ